MDTMYGETQLYSKVKAVECQRMDCRVTIIYRFLQPESQSINFADLTYINLSFSVLNHFDYFFLVLALIIIADKLTFVVIYNAFSLFLRRRFSSSSTPYRLANSAKCGCVVCQAFRRNMGSEHIPSNRSSLSLGSSYNFTPTVNITTTIWQPMHLSFSEHTQQASPQ